MFTGYVIDKGLSLIRISVIKLSLVCLFMKTIASYLGYTGYLNFIKTHFKSCFIATSSSCTATYRFVCNFDFLPHCD